MHTQYLHHTFTLNELENQNKKKSARIKIMTQRRKSKSRTQRHAKANIKNLIRYKHNNVGSLFLAQIQTCKLITHKRSLQVESRNNNIIKIKLKHKVSNRNANW